MGKGADQVEFAQRLSARPQLTHVSACPFCGRSDLLGVEPHSEGGFLSVRCRACGCIGPARRSESDVEAWAAWNDRKTPNAAVTGPAEGGSGGVHSYVAGGTVDSVASPPGIEPGSAP